MKNQEIVYVPEQAAKHVETKKSNKTRLSEIIGEAMGLIACMCVSAIVIALTVKFIMWII